MGVAGGLCCKGRHFTSALRSRESSRGSAVDVVTLRTRQGYGATRGIGKDLVAFSNMPMLEACLHVLRHLGPAADLPDALGEIPGPDLRGVVEFHDVHGGHDFRVFLSEPTETLESGRDPGDVVGERAPPWESEGPKG